VLPAATDEDLNQTFDTLSAVKDSSMFWIGDFLVHTDLRKGDAYTRALSLTDNAPDTLYKAKWVCKSLPPERRANLSYSHQLDVLGECKGDADKAVRFLRLTQQDRMTVRKIRK